MKLSGLPLEAFNRKYVTIKIDGFDFNVRVISFGHQSNPTLVMTHGYASFAVSHFMIMKTLAENYRVIMFDNSSWGANTRLDHCSGLDSSQAANRYLLTWMEAFFDAINDELPDKYFLYGHSNGGYQLGLYASKHPERIAKLFLNSPSGTRPLPDLRSYDPYKHRSQDKENKFASIKEVEKSIKDRRESRHPFKFLKMIPAEKREEKFLKMAKNSHEDFSRDV